MAVLGVCLIIAAASFTAARLASASIVAYVVEETLVQKAPPGTDPLWVRFRFRTMLSGSAGKAARIDRLMDIAQALEKSQQLTAPEFERLLAGE